MNQTGEGKNRKWTEEEARTCQGAAAAPLEHDAALVDMA